MIIRVMTYNVHSCIGLSKKDSLPQINNLFEVYKPSIVGLNEVEKMSPRTLFVDQAKKLAQNGFPYYVFGPAIKIGPFGFFGNAILSKFPIIAWECIKLHSKIEFRACIKARIQLPGTELTVVVTHLGLNKEERVGQIETLAGLIRGERTPVILMGDFNAFTDELRPLEGLVRDLGVNSGPTFPADNPTARIDYILVSENIVDYSLEVINSDASDHLPVLATLEV